MKTTKIDLKSYLQKVINVKKQNKKSLINNISSVRGYGYVSESKISWATDYLELREHFPNSFMPNCWVKFMDFDSSWPMKNSLLSEVQRDNLDIMLFHNHGDNLLQNINEGEASNSIKTSKENIKIYLRSEIRSAIKNGEKKEDVVDYYMKQLDVPRNWCEEAMDTSLIKKDSIYYSQLDISINDILGVSPNALFVMLDACYSGAFQEGEYIAGAYIFNSGKTIVTQGNTVNVLQDKWSSEYIGLLSLGLRIGHWHKYVQSLETHLFGDRSVLRQSCR